MKKPKIIYMGTPEFAVSPLRALIENGFEIAGVVTVPDKPSGRGLKINESEVKKFAISQGLKIMQPVRLRDESFINQLKELNADMFIVVAFRMLPEIVWSIPPMGTFNLHASLLPCYRGAAPINWAIINGEKESGVTTFLINGQIDTGNILLQERYTLNSAETAGTLHDRLMEMGAGLVVKTAEGLSKGTLAGKPQDIPDGKIIPAPKITRETCIINWEDTAEHIDRLIRGLSPYPGAISEISDGNKKIMMKIFEAQAESEDPEPGMAPGCITTDGKTLFRVKCGKGSIKITCLQAAGKRRMAVKDFLSGFRNMGNFSFSKTII